MLHDDLYREKVCCHQSASSIEVFEHWSHQHHHTFITVLVIGGLIERGDYSIQLSAEVGLLSRNIRIIGEDYPDLVTQSYGARVLVGRYSYYNVEYTGLPL